MKLVTDQIQRVTRVSLPERLVMSNADETRDALIALIEQGQRHLVLDLSGVNFIDSSGLAVLIAAYKAVQAVEGALVLQEPNANVRALIELTRLHQLFAIYEDGEAAVQDLQAA